MHRHWTMTTLDIRDLVNRLVTEGSPRYDSVKGFLQCNIDLSSSRGFGERDVGPTLPLLEKYLACRSAIILDDTLDLY